MSRGPIPSPMSECGPGRHRSARRGSCHHHHLGGGPGAVSTHHEAAYGHFAAALAEQLAAPGVPVDQAVARARLRVHQLTNGRDTPWEVSTLTPPGLS